MAAMAGCGGESRGAPTTPKDRQGQGGCAMLGTRRQCWGQGGCAGDRAALPCWGRTSLSDSHRSSFFHLWCHCPRGHSEDVSHLPGTAGGDPAAVIQGKASGDPALQLGWAEPGSALLSPRVCARGAMGALLLLGQKSSSHILHLGKLRNWARGGCWGRSGSAHHPASSLGSVATPATCPVLSRDPSSFLPRPGSSSEGCCFF